MAIEEGFAEIVKSPVVEDVTVRDTSVEWANDPLVAVTVIE